MVRTVQTVQTVHDSTDSTDISEDGRAGAGRPCRIKGSEASLHFYQTFARSQLGISRDLRLRRLYSRDRCRGGARSPFLSPCSVPGSEGMWHLGVAGRDQFVRAQHPMCKAAEKSMAEA
jgi:hypothetical protein